MNRLFFAVGALVAFSLHAEPPPPPGTFRNPINSSADPWMGFVDGYYYLATTQGNRVEICKARSIGDFATAKPKVLWEKGKGVWAPEFHRLRGPNGVRWFCYFTKTDGADKAHRMFVMESRGPRIDDAYGPPVQVRTDPEDEFYAIDGTVFVHPNGRVYFLWAGHPGHRLFISEMASPTRLKGERQLIEASGFGCEEVREGPFILTHGNRIFLTYSVCHTGKPDYKVGTLWTTVDKDPMKPESWTQVETPILARADENGVYGPGHHSFFKSPNGREDWIAYHGKTTSEFTTQGRTTRIQKVEWTPDGMIVPIVPLPLNANVPLPAGDPKARR